MTVRVDQDAMRREDASRTDLIEIGLVNSMPDAALETTERQFIDLVRSAAGDLPVRLRFFSLPEVPRGERGRRHVAASYGGMDEARNGRLDALIVTGTEPRAAALPDEPYWPALAALIDWAEHNTISTIWSCLAAHAAVLHLDGIRRHPLAEKCFGVFACTKVAEHPLTMGLAPEIPVPHSRWNALRGDELAARGYEVLTRSPQAGVDAFSRQGGSLFVFFQGHPEYDAASLPAEYRRDFARFVRRESETCPLPPRGCFDAPTTEVLMRLRARALRDRREEVLAELATAASGRELREAWRPAATRIYRNWLALVAARKARRLAPAAFAPAPFVERRRRNDPSCYFVGTRDRRAPAVAR
ncbi:MAG TPA: homoserine O-succinyltransferase [Xanthobacteraceae bacterium]|nr:homoserine O-succinyltransferase [Xanthobacteraceae bacterium]